MKFQSREEWRVVRIFPQEIADKLNAIENAEEVLGMCMAFNSLFCKLVDEAFEAGKEFASMNSGRA